MKNKVIDISAPKTAIEFFSGIGLARAGMAQAGVKTIWANDIDETKCMLYRQQWGGEHLICDDVFDLNPLDIPSADIAWASSPCTNLSLAGKREGLSRGSESKAFFGFIDAIRGMGERKPRALILENVCGLATSHNGEDYRKVVECFNNLGYSVDSFELNARRWLPQSRPRMFVVGLLNPIGEGRLDTSARPDKLRWIHMDSSLKTPVTPLPGLPELMLSGFTEIADKVNESDARWWDEERVERFVDSLSESQLIRFREMKKGSKIVARTAYRRTRNGKPVWEVRNDDIAGCLRTARGGSSKQAVVFLGKNNVRIRWMTGNEYAKLQGASKYKTDGFSESKIQYAFGDAVAVPVVNWLLRAAVLPSLISEDEGVEVNAEVC